MCEFFKYLSLICIFFFVLCVSVVLHKLMKNFLEFIYLDMWLALIDAEKCNDLIILIIY